MAESFETRGSLISQLRTKFREISADSRLTDRQIWASIDKHSRWIISREDKKLQLMSYDTIFQTAKCVEVEDAPAIDECCGIRSKCVVRRTKEKLPDMYEGEDGVLIKAVYTIDGSQEFVGIDIQEYMRKLENPDSKYDKGKYFFYNNGYLYFPKEKSLRMVMVKALFIDQIVNKCEKGTHVECLPAFDWQVRIPKKLLGEIMSHVDQDFLPYKQIREDEKIDKNQTI